MADEVLMVLKASPGRRVLGVGTVLTLGAIAVYVALFEPPGHFGWTVFLLVLGMAALWLSNRMRQATMAQLELTHEVLRSSTGEVLAQVGDIEALERGVFAFKPSNGFTLRLKEGASGARRWEPGLWWRMARRIGVGGVTPGAQSRAMAEILAELMQQQAR
ncbi:hypothetical protein BXY70_1133 [Roseovarius halotolerans]|uniref:Uncharacterized protein n=1 Tax=Roseovarius halotolerans TaxID=505353 RepID=A0A1X6Y8S9_9RHOB|nr:hypothetical protein [Roseovarius halotolerans]RKT35105.1 hypothetical protein BXY70_1133 [Roseovarius halotolerans]SLN13761.1 hypothetical protein ROH8110_00263 [Roseovarius halotolerans]